MAGACPLTTDLIMRVDICENNNNNNNNRYGRVEECMDRESPSSKGASTASYQRGSTQQLAPSFNKLPQIPTYYLHTKNSHGPTLTWMYSGSVRLVVVPRIRSGERAPQDAGVPVTSGGGDRVNSAFVLFELTPYENGCSAVGQQGQCCSSEPFSPGI